MEKEREEEKKKKKEEEEEKKKKEKKRKKNEFGEYKSFYHYGILKGTLCGFLSLRIEGREHPIQEVIVTINICMGSIISVVF